MDEILLAEYDPAWPEQYASEAEQVRLALNGIFALRPEKIEHIGSTAVPGLAAKPVIDILIGIDRASLADDREHAVPILEAMSYSYWRGNPNPERLLFVRGLPPNGPRTHHVHIVEFDGFDWRAKLAFRDTLRACPKQAALYVALKRDLAARFRHDREAYTEGKSDLIQRILSESADHRI